jgi:hypothetical protein
MMSSLAPLNAVKCGGSWSNIQSHLQLADARTSGQKRAREWDHLDMERSDTRNSSAGEAKVCHADTGQTSAFLQDGEKSVTVFPRKGVGLEVGVITISIDDLR